MGVFKSEIEQEYDEKRKKRRAVNLSHAEKGVVFFDLDMAHVEEGVVIGAGTYIGPAVVITGDTEIGDDCVIGQNCRIENSRIGGGCHVDQSVVTNSEVGENTAVGPFAYMRPGSFVGARCKIGDFVEIKNSVIGDDTKISHLSYIGDADLGTNINVGCGVVFVNYDGREKHRSTVGDGAFIGCNVNIISPVTIESGSYVAAGSTVSRRVPSGALLVARPSAQVREGWVEKRGLLKDRLEKLEGKDS
ncbi:MAG: UDP-N-acetylglucosamine diphosphorylase [Clostridiales Family XIII bacterium]|jgi:bifunctional UDP-N-acetylglucosamine pyrophosphorylase/glucosamine-1-phosphate N-acetyltransferase|nr:UDP-N-acetylglucosamine diphosphorylase [Clostridiales Family XIII bacterium]